MLNLNFLNDVSYHRRITRPDLVHHLLGNGRLQAVVQVTENPAARNALVLHLMSPERFADRHKVDSFTFHQQLGPELTMVGVYHDGRFYLPNPRQTTCDLRYGLYFEDEQPVFRATYPLDYTIEGQRHKSPFNIEETWFCPPDQPVLLRRVRVVNRRGLEAAEATVLAFMLPNQALFPEAHFVSAGQTAVAGHFGGGDEFVALAALREATAHVVAEFPLPLRALSSGRLADAGPSADDKDYVRPQDGYTNYPLLPISPHVGAVLALQFDLGELAPGAAQQVELAYGYGQSEAALLADMAAVREAGFDALWERGRTVWQSFNRLNSGDEKVDNLFRAARSGLRAAVAEGGQMNAGIWGYGAEWVRDSSLACVGVIVSGQFTLARAMLDHMLRDMVTAEGLAFGEGQFYDLQRAELDQNGELLHALWLYWNHARDDSLLREQWAKICALAEFPLRPEFWVEEAAMVRGERDVRERDLERHGLLPGFELAHQMWVSIGLNRAAEMATALGESGLAERWGDYGRRMWEAVVGHPQFQLVENGYFMKRRMENGEFQRTTTMKPYVHRPTEEPRTKMYPRCLNREGALEPDGSEAWPIAHGLVAADGELARRTLLRMEQLWNQEWDFGGYPLHHLSSEPTKAGAWPLTFYIVTQAAVEAREFDTVRRNLDWMLNSKDGRGFMWWEYRDVQPELQIDHGVIPWLIYGEPLFMLVHHMLGFRPMPEGIVVRPRLLPEWSEVRATMRNGRYQVRLAIHQQGDTIQRVTVNGQTQAAAEPGQVFLPIPTEDLDVEIWLAESFVRH